MRPSLTVIDRDAQALLRRLSRRMQIACWVLLVVLPMALVIDWATAEEATLAAHADLRAAGIVWLMAAVIAQGQRLADENEGFV